MHTDLKSSIGTLYMLKTAGDITHSDFYSIAGELVKEAGLFGNKKSLLSKVKSLFKRNKKSKFDNFLDAAQDRLGRAYDYVKNDASETLDFVKKNPIKSLSAAGVTGYMTHKNLSDNKK